MLKPQPMFRFGDAAQVHRHHQDLRGQFRALGLEMMLGHPEGVVAAHTPVRARRKGIRRDRLGYIDSRSGKQGQQDGASLGTGRIGRKANL